MKVTIADVVIRTRDIEIPDECPYCKSQVRFSGLSLTTLEYIVRDSRVGLEEAKPCLDEERPFTFELDDEGAVITYVMCAECGHDLADGRYARIETVEPKKLERSAWSESIGQLFFPEEKKAS